MLQRFRDSSQTRCVKDKIEMFQKLQLLASDAFLASPPQLPIFLDYGRPKDLLSPHQYADYDELMHYYCHPLIPQYCCFPGSKDGVVQWLDYANVVNTEWVWAPTR